jgi:hypothetical protein
MNKADLITIDSDVTAPLLQKPVHQFFNIFMESQLQATPRGGSWLQTPAKLFFLSFAPQATAPRNPTMLPYRLSRETLDGVFRMFIWE